MENLEHVDATLNYLDPSSERPVIYLYPPPEGVPPRTGRYVKHTMPIYNARALAAEPSLNQQGFALVRHRSTVSDFYDPDEVVRVYYPEVERVIREATGATRVHVFDHNVRCRPRARSGDKRVQEPVRVVHNDYTLKSGPQRVRDLLPAQAERLLKYRFAVINAWKPIMGPVEESPLAVCDATSMKQRDFIEQDLKYRDRTGEVYAVVHSPSHRWFYYPRMTADEVLLLKCYDSDGSRTRFTAHTAFEDPTSGPDAPARESIEVRTLVFFAPPE
jgi:hypothetical protein